MITMRRHQALVLSLYFLLVVILPFVMDEPTTGAATTAKAVQLAGLNNYLIYAEQNLQSRDLSLLID